MKPTISPQPFIYAGQEFTPVIRNIKYDFYELSSKLWGGSSPNDPSMEGLKEINLNFDYDEFYKIAKKNGCGKIDVFLLNGDKVIPCAILRYFGEPNFFSKQKLEDRYYQEQKQFIEQEIEEIKISLLKKLDKAKQSGAVPPHWVELGNRHLSKSIIDSFCVDRPYQPFTDKKESKNLQLFL